MLIVALVAPALAPPGWAQTVYQPTDDAWAVTAGGNGTGKQEPATTYGTADIDRLWIRAASTLGRGTYLKFDLTNLTGPVTKAELKVTVDVAPNAPDLHTVFLYTVDDDTWTEETLTGDNRPAWGDELGSANTPNRASTGPDTTWVYDVTAYVNASLGADDKLIGFALGNPTGNTPDYDGTDIRIFSKEAVLLGDGPVLSIEGGSITAVDEFEVPVSFKVEQNYPNPFNPETSLTYVAPNAGRLRVVVYNLLGQVVTTLMDRTVTAGEGRISWNARDALGRDVGTGIYLARFEFGDQVSSVAMTLLR